MQVMYNTVYESLLTGAHTLIAGTTGSGKTTVLNAVIYHLAQEDPKNLGMVLIDPKRVGLMRYRDLPHVIRHVTEPGDIIHVLRSLVWMMEKRYQRMERGSPPGPQVVVIIDELADLMITARKDVMPLVQRLLQLGRESRMKIIIATQAPGRKIIPAELTLNIDTRLALRCISSIESRQIVGISGAEALPVYGYGILRTAAGCRQVRLKPIPDKEIEKLVSWWKG